MTPKKAPADPVKPGCATMILVPTSTMVGGFHAPVVGGLIGVFAAVTPEIAVNVLDTML